MLNIMASIRLLACVLRTLPKTAFHKRLACRARHAPRNVAGEMRFNGLCVRYTDLLSLYMEYKDIFLRRIYHFEAAGPEPFIIDGGGCIGMSVLYFKSAFPGARVLCFEPDGQMCDILRQNVRDNRMTGVEIVQAGLSGDGSEMAFAANGSDGGRTVEGAGATTTIKTVRLSGYIGRPVDFLKLNIEGQELTVLEEAEASGRFGNIRELVLEYHGWPGERQRLGDILNILDRQGYRYIVHDFDEETCPASKPPFRMLPATAWYCLVYARRFSGEQGPGACGGEA